MITWRPIALLGVGILTLPLWPSPWLGLLCWLVIITVLCGVDLLTATDPARVRMWREGDRLIRLGGSATVTLNVRNEGTGTIRGRIRDAWPPSANADRQEYSLDLPPGSVARLTTTLTPSRRGDRHSSGVTIRSVGPMGFAYRQVGQAAARRMAPPWKLRVLPPFHTRRLLNEKLARLRVIEGTVAVRGRGQGTEFDALREYVAGDDVRSIDWRASARSQSIVVKNWRVERDRRIVTVIDTGRTSAVRVGDEPRLDAQIEASLLLSTVASVAGDRIDALAVDTEVRAAVDGGVGRNVIPRLLQATAPLEPALAETDFGLVVSEVLRREAKRALVVLFTSLEPGVITESLLPSLPSLTARHRVIVATVSDPQVARLRDQRDTTMDIYRAAAAEQSLLERRKVAAALARHDVDVIDEPVDVFASAVVDRYLMLKATGRL
ncbi:uncharacterized protein (DUF58 family) [Stackebrandtia endophytica]|uniref:Uncharacterized protein (DUF58 family) n=1 Tax=Stackebrandtia endophytica TaxID=1496996 RepID=A0A543AT88_9ACTN|nr:DUF58 domain-containing protein [Stackebrandtia endophytica]TQL75766.1 uncharacterized protein (DUF58 family) [Stackebrandtia endophytica]